MQNGYLSNRIILSHVQSVVRQLAISIFGQVISFFHHFLCSNNFKTIQQCVPGSYPSDRAFTSSDGFCDIQIFLGTDIFGHPRLIRTRKFFKHSLLHRWWVCTILQRASTLWTKLGTLYPFVLLYKRKLKWQQKTTSSTPVSGVLYCYSALFGG